MLTFFSCEKDITSPKSKGNNSITNREGEDEEKYLVFNSREEFEATYAQLKDFSKEDLEQWEANQNGFVSMATLYTRVVDNEYNLMMAAFAAAENPAALEEGSGFQYSDYTHQYANMLILSPEEGISMNIAVPGMARFVNKNGLIQIGNEIFKYSQDNVKIITDGNSDKIDLLDHITTTDSEMNIEVNEFYNSSKTNTVCTGFPNQSCDKNSGAFRHIAYETFTYAERPAAGINGPQRETSYFIHLRCLRRYLGVWLNGRTTQFSSNGSYTYNDNGSTITKYYSVSDPIDESHFYWFLFDRIITNGGPTDCFSHLFIYQSNHTTHSKGGLSCTLNYNR